MPTPDGSSVCVSVSLPAADRFGIAVGWRGLGVAAGLGAMSGLGQAPVSIPVFTLLGLGLLTIMLTRAPTMRRAAWLGWAAGTGYFTLTLSWIVEPFLVDIARHGWMAPFALVFLSAGLALFWGAAFGLAHRFGRPSVVWRAASLIVTLTIAEMLRSYMLTGFPWALIGHAWIGWPPMQLAAFVGAHGLTFLTIALAAASVALWPRRRDLMGVAAIAVALYGAGMLLGAAKPITEGRPTARLVQPNIPQDIKWDQDLAEEHLRRYLDLTGAPGTPDIVVWPETALPYFLNDAQPVLNRIASVTDAPVILGMQRWEAGRYFNSLVSMDPEGRVGDVYDKVHLVPFGEYVPAPWLLTTIGLDIFTADAGYGYSFGSGLRLIDGGPLGRILPLICYEAVFPQDIHRVDVRAEAIVQITNDAWFGHISGPYQHLAQARLRAVEQGLPVVRVANTGVSAVIGPKGRVIARIPLDEAGMIDVTVPAPLAPTLYAATGDGPMALLLLLAALGLFLRGLRNSD